MWFEFGNCAVVKMKEIKVLIMKNQFSQQNSLKFLFFCLKEVKLWDFLKSRQPVCDLLDSFKPSQHGLCSAKLSLKCS